MTDVEKGLELLREAVPRVVTELFEKDRRVVLLSSVGQRLRREGIDFKSILGETGLATFIRQHLAGQVDLQSASGNPKIVAAYPSSVDLSQELDPTPAVTRRTSPSEHQLPTSRQFVREVWYAFSHALENDKLRFLILAPNLMCLDVPAGEAPHGAFEVARDLILAPGTSSGHERNRKIFSNIELWAEQNGISLNLLTARSKPKISRSALDVLLHSLSQAELVRISLPLDVIKSLRTKRVD